MYSAKITVIIKYCRHYYLCRSLFPIPCFLVDVSRTILSYAFYKIVTYVENHLDLITANCRCPNIPTWSSFINWARKNVRASYWMYVNEIPQRVLKIIFEVRCAPDWPRWRCCFVRWCCDEVFRATFLCGLSW